MTDKYIYRNAPGECPECGAFEWEDNGCDEDDLEFTLLCPVCGYQTSPNM